jgi:hypothetical protein
LVTNADENQSEFLPLQVHVVPMISEKPIAFVQLKKVTGVLLSSKCVAILRKPCFRGVISSDLFRRLGKSGLAFSGGWATFLRFRQPDSSVAQW